MIMSHPLAAVEGNCALLDQACSLLLHVPTTTFAQRRANHSSVGAHFRHVLDHYRALLDGWPARRINYDARQRDPAIEQDPRAAIAAAQEICLELEAITEDESRGELEVHLDAGGGPDAFDWRLSTLGRELQFVASHTVHHFAIMRLLLEDEGVSVPAAFGVAPSTRAHAGMR